MSHTGWREARALSEDIMVAWTAPPSRAALGWRRTLCGCINRRDAAPVIHAHDEHQLRGDHLGRPPAPRVPPTRGEELGDGVEKARLTLSRADAGVRRRRFGFRETGGKNEKTATVRRPARTKGRTQAPCAATRGVKYYVCVGKCPVGMTEVMSPGRTGNWRHLQFGCGFMRGAAAAVFPQAPEGNEQSLILRRTKRSARSACEKSRSKRRRTATWRSTARWGQT